MVRSFGVGIVGTRNVYIFVPSIHRKSSLGHSFSERNTLYLNTVFKYISCMYTCISNTFG